MATLTLDVSPVEQARVEQFLRYERMDNAGKIAEQARLQAEARARRVAAMTPEKRALYEARMAEETIAADAERARLAGLPPDQVLAEMALRHKKAAEAQLARLPAKAVEDAAAYLSTAKPEKEN